MPGIERPETVVAVVAHPKTDTPYRPGSVDLNIKKGGSITLTPDEARKLADLLRDGATEAETEPTTVRRRVFGDEE